MFTIVKDIQLSKNFKLSEFACHDGSGEVYYTVDFINKMQALRDLLGLPINVVSGHRTPTYNTKVGGALKSQHLEIAGDIKVKGKTPLEVAFTAEKVGFTGIGVYTHDNNYFTHVDCRPTKSYWKDAAGHKVIGIKSLSEIKL
jgi:hypothetical protein